MNRKSTFKINQEIFIILDDQLRQLKITGIIQFQEKFMYYIFKSAKNHKKLDRFWMNNGIKDNTLLLVDENEIFKTARALQTHLFKDL